MSPPSVTITQLEPVVFLRGQSATGDDARGRRRPVNVDAPPSQLRGLLTLYLPKPSKIREISISLTGTARTDWPEGIGPNRLELVEEVTIFKQVVSLFNAKEEGSQPGRRRSNSVGPGIGLSDDVDWSLADAAHARRSPGASSSSSTPGNRGSSGNNNSTSNHNGGSTLARQLADVAARAGTAIIPPTFRPEINLSKPSSKASRPSLQRTGSGTTSWSQSGSSPGASPAQPPPAHFSRAAASVPFPARDNQGVFAEAFGQNASLRTTRTGRPSPSRPISIAGDAEDRGRNRDVGSSFNRWNTYLSQQQGEQPPLYVPRSAPLYGYDQWPSTTKLTPPATESDGNTVETSSSDAVWAATSESRRSPLPSPSLEVGAPQMRPSAPSSPTMSRAASNIPGKGILHHSPAASRNKESQAVRFDRPPAAPAASQSVSPAGAATRDHSRSAPSNRRSSADFTDRGSQSKGKQINKGSSDKGKKTGLKGLIGTLLKENDAKFEDDTGAAAEWKEFKKGTYVYPICIPLPSNLPPTLHADFGFNQYALKVTVNRAGALTPNLVADREVKLIHAPDEDTMEESDSIVVERSWEDFLSYMVVLSGKSFPIGRKIPLWMKFVPQGKLCIHRIIATLEERTDYFAKGRRVARHEVPRKWTLLKVANENSDEPLLPIISDSPQALDKSPLAPLAHAAAGHDPDSDLLPSIMDPNGPWELAVDLLVPGKTTARINLSTNHAKSSIAVHHLIRIVIRVEKPDGFRGAGLTPACDSKQKLYDIIIEAPITLTSTHTAEEWVSLPNYWSVNGEATEPTSPTFQSEPVSHKSPRPSPAIASRLGMVPGAQGASSSRQIAQREHDPVAAASSPLQLSRRWLALSSNSNEQGPRADPRGAELGGGANPPPPAYEPNARQGERTVASTSINGNVAGLATAH